MHPQVLVADELMSSLDPWVRLSIFEILQNFHDQGGTILLATHSLSVVRYWASYVVALEAGRVVFGGTPQSLLSNPAVMTETGLSKIWWKVDPDFPEKE
jgi:microcin C transport system ATP-binding protein